MPRFCTKPVHRSHLFDGKIPTNNLNGNDEQRVKIPWCKNSKILLGLDYNNNRKRIKFLDETDIYENPYQHNR
uniref:Uncharacterized protein n=1 Tax=Rhizophagus irregularis (strain DAOM 181602 / DAOM 197198 / MUCL 43194) TaxID=747089 RepID=U9U132_RHIID